MLYVGIDVSKEKHDCHIMNSEGEILCDNFSFENSRSGFNSFLKLLKNCNGNELTDIKVGLESTGHYSDNLIGFLKQSKLYVSIFNPLQITLSRKAKTLRKTKTDKCDARFICRKLFEDAPAPYLPKEYHISELKTLSRFRVRLINDLSKQKTLLVRLVDIIFPELNKLFCKIHLKSVYAMLAELPSAKAIAKCHLTKLTNILSGNSRGRYSKAKAMEIRECARNSIGSQSLSLSFELQETIDNINFLQTKIDRVDSEIKTIMDKIDSPILSILGISYTLGAMIISEIGNINNFDSPAKLLAFAGCEPSKFQSGKYNADHTAMVKRGSKYLRYALFSAARMVSINCDVFADYLAKKRAENKHYFVALSHTVRKLVRVIFHLLTTNTTFVAI